MTLEEAKNLMELWGKHDNDPNVDFYCGHPYSEVGEYIMAAKLVGAEEQGGILDVRREQDKPTPVSSDWEKLLAVHWVFDPTANREVYIGSGRYPTLQDFILAAIAQERAKCLKECVAVVKSLTITYMQGLERCGCKKEYSCNFRKGHAACQEEVIEKLTLLSNNTNE